jgi:Zn finger protein HypA/HybF involved in hydrogenase expression
VKRPASYTPATLGSVARAEIIRIIVWCKDCRHQVEPDPNEQMHRYCAEMTVIDWAARLVCGECGSHNADFVLTGALRRDQRLL